ncbi:lytic transglycosylase domain-containing protein [Brevundimonas variabilis]|uniref:Type IV secretion system protein VirB1 n=1 Tax=Brevundimonas variabilis TaxID=74312 RepID=A0A7W9CIZ9_9CAUL|nr:lytic transglycosylase domain-containing protein [Brevundimonas variabilis]MBB5746543.1 type IV secretion system protein VirB1 [Brevundimonas variabilis]
MLDLSLILALAERCAPQVAPQTIAAVAYAESRFNPVAIGVNSGPRPVRTPRSREEAIRTTRSLLARGANLDLGLGQINSANLEWLNLSIEDVFDPCKNLTAAGVVLRSGYRWSVGEDRQVALRVALSRYNTGHPDRGFRNGYVARVEQAAATLGVLALAPDRPAPTDLEPQPAAPEPVAPIGRWDVFALAPSSAVLTFPPSAVHMEF